MGAGLRLTMELMGPEYSMSISTLDSGTKVFLSRRLRGMVGEDLLEKQNAEQGLMPLIGNENAEYGYEGENRAFVTAFSRGIQPELDFHAGRDVTELLMACYMSAEQGRVIVEARGAAALRPAGGARRNGAGRVVRPARSVRGSIRCLGTHQRKRQPERGPRSGGRPGWHSLLPAARSAPARRHRSR